MTYADYIRSLPCSVCADDTTVQQHHLINIDGLTKGMALKMPEIISIPLCARHHRELHLHVEGWEVNYGDQEYHLVQTLAQAAFDGWEITRDE